MNKKLSVSMLSEELLKNLAAQNVNGIETTDVIAPKSTWSASMAMIYLFMFVFLSFSFSCLNDIRSPLVNDYSIGMNSNQGVDR